MPRFRLGWGACLAVAILAVVLAVVNAGLVLANQAAQREVTRRQDYIAQTAQMARIDQVVATTLAEAAQRDRNEPLTALLTRNGIAYHPPQAAAGAAPAAAPARP